MHIPIRAGGKSAARSGRSILEDKFSKPTEYDPGLTTELVKM
jgi:hypothetical protein